MLNYDQLEALEAVLDAGSFHKAARKLHISQSAVSQRVCALEEQLGKSLIVRSNPPKATRFGIQLIQHLREVRLKENDVLVDDNRKPSAGWLEVTVGVNADSAATWFFEALAFEFLKRKLLVKALVETHVHVHDLIESGEAVGCVTGRKIPLPGCDLIYLGSLQYICVCTPLFKDKFFPKGLKKEHTNQVPTVLFDKYDTIHHHFLKSYFGIKNPKFPHHTVNSTSGYLALVLSGMAYGMAPKLQVKPFIEIGSLIELAPRGYAEQQLYWMYPRRGSKGFEDIWRALQASAKKLLQ